MFICNIKINSNTLKKIAIIFLILILVAVFMYVGYRFYDATTKVTVNDEMPNAQNSQIEINNNNYTDILKDSHENIDKYVGKKIKFVGFVYRLYDFNENQFVLGREMIISPNNQAVVVGFLCDSSASNIDSSIYEHGTWVEVEGTIIKGNYHGDMPIVDVTCMNKTNVPCDEFVFSPSDTYVNTEI